MLNGNIIWSKVGKADSDNARRQYMVALVEDQCVPFPLLLHESNGVTGICVVVNQTKLQVNPVDLVSSLFELIL